ncbi:hypothetical protein AB4Y44_09940 [Paraburkholderia sp. BR10937]|uniref:hypothetical protein n=1 Tax=Paraburkholderia sp. BR10937 TaxID=3236994 RepID=UPI0034D209C3
MRGKHKTTNPQRRKSTLAAYESVLKSEPVPAEFLDTLRLLNFSRLFRYYLKPIWPREIEELKKEIEELDKLRFDSFLRKLGLRDTDEGSSSSEE